jgi:acyl carrier protein
MIDRASIRATLGQFLREDTSAEFEHLDDSTCLRDGLGLDSVDFVGVVMRIEGHYHIRLSRVEMDKLKTVSDLLTLVQMKSHATPLAA